MHRIKTVLQHEIQRSLPSLFVNHTKFVARSLHCSQARTQLLHNQQLDLDYVLNPDNLDQIERNVQLRRKNALLAELQQAKRTLGTNELQEWLKHNANRLPNQLHPRWTKVSEQEAINYHKDQFEVNSFGPTRQQLHSSQPFKRAETLYRMRGWLQLPQHEQIGFVGGDRSYVMLDQLCELRDALISFTISELTTKHRFIPVTVPNLIYEEAVGACGFSTHGQRSQVYTLDGLSNKNWRDKLCTKNGNKSVARLNAGEEEKADEDENGEDESQLQHADHEISLNEVCLAGTAEISLAAMHLGEQLDYDKLPMRYCTVSRCYRAEVSPRKEEGGLYRVHYFDKLEMFAFTTPEQSDQTLQQFVHIQQDLFTLLGLGGRVLDMPPHELGSSAACKYDIECWLPGRQTYGELSSASNCTDYQSRRLNVRSRRLQPDLVSNELFRLQHVHTVNGTACAIPRMLIALAETHQQSDGSISIPEVLRPYMEGRDRIDQRNACFVGKRKHQEQKVTFFSSVN